MQCFTRLSKLATVYGVYYCTKQRHAGATARNPSSCQSRSGRRRESLSKAAGRYGPSRPTRRRRRPNVIRGATSDCVLRHGICFVLLAHFRPLQRTHNSGRGGPVPGDACRQRRRRRRRSRTPASASISFCFLLPGSKLNAGVCNLLVELLALLRTV